MIRFACPVCGLTLSVSRNAAGRKGSCPSCGQRLQVPTPQPRRTVLGRLLGRDADPHSSSPSVHPPPERGVVQVRPVAPVAPVAPAVPIAQVDHDYREDLDVRDGPVIHVHAGPRYDRSGAAHSLGISSLVLSFLAFPFCWMPIIGVFFAGIGLLLGIMGICASAGRGGSGIGFALAGSAVNLVALIIAIRLLGIFIRL